MSRNLLVDFQGSLLSFWSLLLILQILRSHSIFCNFFFFFKHMHPYLIVGKAVAPVGCHWPGSADSPLFLCVWCFDRLPHSNHCDCLFQVYNAELLEVLMSKFSRKFLLWQLWPLYYFNFLIINRIWLKHVASKVTPLFIQGGHTPAKIKFPVFSLSFPCAR